MGGKNDMHQQLFIYLCYSTQTITHHTFNLIYIENLNVTEYSMLYSMKLCTHRQFLSMNLGMMHFDAEILISIIKCYLKSFYYS
jgi:hypothetical protein